jgi:hypothetical protein
MALLLSLRATFTCADPRGGGKSSLIA